MRASLLLLFLPDADVNLIDLPLDVAGHPTRVDALLADLAGFTHVSLPQDRYSFILYLSV